MGDQKWLDEYSGQSVDQLIALQGEYRTDSIVLAFEQAVDQKAAKMGSDKISDVERTILAIEALEREVNNGGYRQLFYNSNLSQNSFFTSFPFWCHSRENGNPVFSAFSGYPPSRV